MVGFATMSSTQRLGKAVESSSHKRVRTGTTIPPAPTVPRGQTQRYGAKAITSEGKKWYKSHMEAKYFSDVILDDVNLEREFQHIMHRLQELHMGFIFQDPLECNVSVVWEFYANWKLDAHSYFMIVRGMESTAKWIRHGHRGYHQAYPYAHMNRETQGWLKIVMNYLIPGLNFTEVTRDRASGSPREECGLHGTFVHHALDVTKAKGSENMHGPTLTTAERNRRDDMITAPMFGLEMLRHKNRCQASSEEQLDETTLKYPLNEHAEALLGLGPAFLQHVWDDVPIDEDKRGRKIEDEVAEKKGQEPGEYTMREHLCVAELIGVCRKGISLNSGVHDGSASQEVSSVCNYRRGN
ncbi:hypothetical protein H5410_022666, partial [Solanum commersonii]